MDRNTFDKHICNNTFRNLERESQIRVKNEAREMDVLPRNETNLKDENDHSYCDCCEIKCKNEHGGEVYVTDISREAYKNCNFRESIWTGKYLQATLMSIPFGDDLGVEIHRDTDQCIRIEHGNAVLLSGNGENCLCERKKLRQGDIAFIPAGTWHNIINIGRCTLKISSIYAPPHHSRCTVEKHK